MLWGDDVDLNRSVLVKQRLFAGLGLGVFRNGTWAEALIGAALEADHISAGRVRRGSVWLGEAGRPKRRFDEGDPRSFRLGPGGGFRARDTFFRFLERLVLDNFQSGLLDEEPDRLESV